jgi:hypothetical protein
VVVVEVAEVAEEEARVVEQEVEVAVADYN